MYSFLYIYAFKEKPLTITSMMCYEHMNSSSPLRVGHVKGGEQLLWWVACRDRVGRWGLMHCHQALCRIQNSQWLSSFTSISLPIINRMMFPSSFLTLFDLINWWLENYYKFYDNNDLCRGRTIYINDSLKSQLSPLNLKDMSQNWRIQLSITKKWKCPFEYL